MILPYQIYRNITGKKIQHELRLGEDFHINPDEEVVVYCPAESTHNSGNIPGFIVFCPDYQGAFEAHRRCWISTTKFNDSFELVKPPVFKSQLEMFYYIWNTRDHFSQLTGKSLVAEGSYQWHHQFLHVLPKGTYKHWKLNPYNILLARPEEHEIQERYPYFLEVRQALTLEYHTKYK